MIAIQSLEVAGFELDFLDLSWELVKTLEDPTNYTFTVERSESPEGPFEVLSQPLVDQYTYRDRRVQLRSFWRRYYYRIKIIQNGTGSYNYSQVSYLHLEPDLKSLEIARRHQKLLKVKIGTPVLIYKKRTSGPACLVCYDDILNQKTKSSCTFCFDSRYRGGFLAPIPTFVNFTSEVVSLDPGQVVEREPSQRTVDMTGYPLLSPGDMIVHPLNRRYRVVQIQERDHQGFIHRQIVTVKEIARTDVVYKFKVSPELFPTRNGPLWPDPADFGKLQHIVERPSGR